MEIAHELGVKWLEKNFSIWIKHLLDLISKCGPLAYTKYIKKINIKLFSDFNQLSEVVFMRRCVLYIFRNTLGQMLSEQYQISACKFLGAFLAEYNNSNGLIFIFK